MISPLRYVVSLTKRSKLTILTVAIVTMFVTSSLVIVYSFEMSNKSLIEKFESNYYVISSNDDLTKSRVNAHVNNAAYVWITKGKINNMSTYIIGIYDPNNVLKSNYNCDKNSVILGNYYNLKNQVILSFNNISKNFTIYSRVSFSHFPEYWVAVNYTYFSSEPPNFLIVTKHVSILGYTTKSMTSLSLFYEKTAEEISFDLFLLDIISLVVIYLFINALLMMEIRENSKKIAILRAIGSSNGNIAGLYLLRSLYIGTMGMIIGFSLGVALSYLLSAIIPLLGFLTYFYVYIPPFVFIADLIIAVVGSIIAAISPVRKVLNIKVIRGLRGGAW